MEAFLVLQTLEALAAWTLTLSETAHTKPSNKTSHTRVLYRPRSGMWERGQNQIFRPGCFSLQTACCADLIIESKSAPLTIRKSFDRSYLVPVFMVEVLYNHQPGLIAVMDLWWLTGAQWLVLTKGAYW